MRSGSGSDLCGNFDSPYQHIRAHHKIFLGGYPLIFCDDLDFGHNIVTISHYCVHQASCAMNDLIIGHPYNQNDQITFPYNSDNFEKSSRVRLSWLRKNQFLSYIRLTSAVFGKVFFGGLGRVLLYLPTMVSIILQ